MLLPVTLEKVRLFLWGDVSYGSKEFKIYKVRGIKLTDEVVYYASLNLVSIFIFYYDTDVLAIDCLVNGEQADGSEAASVVGTTTGNSLTYKDI